MSALHIATFVLAAVLLIAAAGKLRAGADTRAEWAAMGIPAVLNRGLLRRLHPAAEIALALALLLPAPFALIAAISALMLVVGYLVIVVRAARLPTPVPCACFGARTPTPITGRTVVRNVLLVVMGALAVAAAAVAGSPFGGAASVDGRVAAIVGVLALATGWFSAPEPAPAGAVQFQAGATAGPASIAASGTVSTAPDGSGNFVIQADSGAPSFYEQGQVATPPEPEDPEDYIRVPIPRAVVTSGDGTPTDLVYLSQLAPQLLIFASPGCGPCETIGARLPQIRKRLPQVVVRVVTRIPADELRELQPTWADGALHDLAGEASRMLQVIGTPSAVLLGADGLLAGGPVIGEPAVKTFIDDIETSLSEA